MQQNEVYTLESVRHLLPQSVLDIAEIIVFEDTEKLVHRLGGTRFMFVGEHGAYFKALSEAIGKDSARKLWAIMKQERGYFIPLCTKKRWQN